ncbi:MAG: PatB family C-S lyase [Cocleimonas sp.]|nr:PatB family C-S lyase [Cocleimonas sp.]
MNIFDKVIDRKNTSSEKWDKYKGRDIIPMWVADSDFETAPEIVEALQQRVVQGVFGYSEQPTTGVQDAIQSHLKSQYGWQIDKSWIVPLPSLVSGLSLSCLMTDTEGDGVVVPQTIYPPFKYVVDNNKRQKIEVPMRLDTSSGVERWVLDLDAFEKAITPQTKLLLFCNPHNPAGTVYTKEELEKIHNICKRYDLLICSDEIHCDLVLDDNKKHIPLAMLNDDAANRSITLMAASKTFNVAGLGFGFAIIPSDTLRDKFKVLVRQRMPDINILAQTATEAAFKHGENWRLEQIEYLRENRDYLMQEINAIEGMKMYPLEATFLAWIDVSGLDLDDPEIFFEEAGVGISAGKYFGDNDFIRLNFACRRSLLEEAVGRIKKAIATL